MTLRFLELLRLGTGLIPGRLQPAPTGGNPAFLDERAAYEARVARWHARQRLRNISLPSCTHPRRKPHRRGNAATRSQLDLVRDWAVEHCGWRHIAGGRARDTGEEMTEYWVPNPAKAFEPLMGMRINGLAGGKWVDLTFEDRRTGRMIHVQTVDTDRHGKPTRRELDNAEIIRRRTGAQVILIPKRRRPKGQA